MHKDPQLCLDDILDAIVQIRDYTKGLDFAAFERDSKTRDAVVRNLEIISDASRRLPDHAKALAPEIEWRKLLALRSFLNHECFGISLPVVWDIVQNKLESLETACLNIAVAKLG
jgi:uncharacterized protein with HEPN domain